MTKDAQAFFADTKNDSVFTIINDFQSIYGKLGVDAATPRGLDVLREVAAARFTGRQVTGSDGGPLVIDVFICTNLASFDLTSASAALSAGVFEVRGDNPTAPAALNEPPTSPRWGVEPRFPSGWPAAQATGPTPAGAQPRYLLFGYPTTASTLGLPPSDGFTGFEVGTRSTVGMDVDKSQLRVGACIPVGFGTGNANRLIHTGSIIPNESPSFCPALALAPNTNTTWLASLAHSLTSLIAPKPLFAKAPMHLLLDDGDFTGGGMGGWSPMGFGAIPVASIVLSIPPGGQPVNSVASDAGTNDSVVVKATINNAPVPGVTITLTIAGNSGVPANAVLYPKTLPQGLPQGVTGADGTVKVYFSAGKAGGYTITAHGELEGAQTQTVTSKLFNIKNP
jgi:hypothetical protein